MKLGLIVLYMLFLLSMTLGSAYLGLKVLRRRSVGQRVREEGPKSHYKKSGTPTFGGLFFLIPLAFAAILSFFFDGFKLYRSLIFAMLIFALIGFLDDYIKVYVNKEGLSVRQKTVLSSLAILFCSYSYLYLNPEAPSFRLPFVGQNLPIEGGWKLVYLIFSILYLYFMINAVNLTDGVDGLASSVSIFVALALALIVLKLKLEVAAELSLIYFSLALISVLLGFLYFNRHPAQVFMGDTGSLALGAGIALAFLYLGIPWALLLVGFIYIIEALSVVLQVAYYKLSGGRRIFKMTPIHHHFELSGWSEWKIVLVFSFITIVLSAIAYLLI